MFLIENHEKEYSEKCIEHNENYIGYSIDSNLNVCTKCISEENNNDKIKYFDEIEISENKRVFSDNYLSKIYSIVYQNLTWGKDKNKLVYELYLNYEYMNSYKENETISFDEISYKQKKIF